MAEAIAKAVLQLATKADRAVLRAELKAAIALGTEATAEIKILKRGVTIRLGSMIILREDATAEPFGPVC
jgi:hypothetical protein